MCGPSNNISFYNLKCNTWVSKTTLTQQEANLKSNNKQPLKSRYHHAAVVKNEQTIFFVGGFDGSVMLNDIIAYRVPKSVVYYDETTKLKTHGAHCSLYPNSGKY